VVVDEELLSSEARRCSSGFFCRLCSPDNICRNMNYGMDGRDAIGCDGCC
jgi:hypothetical protein